MSNKFINIDNIQDLNDSEAESCLGGAFTVFREFHNGVDDDRFINSSGTTMNISETARFRLINENGPVDGGNRFTLTYRDINGTRVGDSIVVRSGQWATGAVGQARFVDIAQDGFGTLDPGRLPVEAIDNSMNGGLGFSIQLGSGLG